MKTRGLVTPQILVGNRKYTRDWKTRVNAETREAAAVEIRAEVEAKGRKLTVEIKLANPAAGLPKTTVVLPVLYQRKALTDVPRGENAGKTLRDFYAVLDTAPPQPLAQVTEKGMKVSFTLPEGVAAQELGIAVLVEDPETMTTHECAAFPLAERKPDLLIIRELNESRAKKVAGMLEARAGAAGVVLATDRARGKAEEYGRTFVFGFSAGAGEAIAFAAKHGKEIDGLILVAPKIRINRKAIEQLPDDLPVFLICGKEDEVTPVAEAEKLRDALKAAGLEVEFRVLKTGTHLEMPEKAALDLMFWARTR